MLADKPTELSRIKLKTWTRQPVPMISEHSAHLTPQPFWHSHLALAIYMVVVVNFDALAQAIDIRIERRRVVFLCWRQDSNPSGSQTPDSRKRKLTHSGRVVNTNLWTESSLVQWWCVACVSSHHYLNRRSRIYICTQKSVTNNIYQHAKAFIT